jgi:hypothetical protein
VLGSGNVGCRERLPPALYAAIDFCADFFEAVLSLNGSGGGGGGVTAPRAQRLLVPLHCGHNGFPRAPAREVLEETLRETALSARPGLVPHWRGSRFFTGGQ